MDIVRFKCNLGNQLFQYAFYQALKSKGREVKASLGYYRRHPDKPQFYLTEVFPKIELDYISDEEFDIIDVRWLKIKNNKKELEEFLQDYKNRFFWVEEKDFRYRPEVFETYNCVFVGFWQTEKYFSSIQDTLLEVFQFSYGEDKLDKWRKRLLDGDDFVAVHVRRGDYLNHPEVWGNLSESMYYYNAIRYMENTFKEPRFIFFSDDINWVKQRYKYKNAIYIEESMFDNYEPWYDMCLMSCCSHNIIANSSFSWWGAWLNRNREKIVVAPEKWFFDGRGEKDICPDTWKRISAGEILEQFSKACERFVTC